MNLSDKARKAVAALAEEISELGRDRDEWRARAEAAQEALSDAIDDCATAYGEGVEDSARVVLDTCGAAKATLVRRIRALAASDAARGSKADK